MDLNGIGKRVRECREAKGVSQFALSDLTGLHRNTINKIESAHNKSVDLMSLDEIAKALCVTLTYLISGPRANKHCRQVKAPRHQKIRETQGAK